MNRQVLCSAILLLAGGLEGCCIRNGEAGAERNATSSSAEIPVGDLRIVDWGPRETRAGIPFNVQAGRHSAIWIKVNNPLDGRMTLIKFNDAFLEGQVSGDVVTAYVSEASYAKEGVYEVRVVARAGQVFQSSDTVSFTVQ